MKLTELKTQFADYAKDIKLNLSSVLSEEGAPGLTKQQIAGIALATAYATKHQTIIDVMQNEARDLLDEKIIHAVKISATIMAMNNIYYRAIHLMSNKDYSTMPAKLRMNSMTNSGVDKTDFELYSLAVSAINGCGMCLDSHEKQLLKTGVSKEGVQSTLRIAAVINAGAQALSIG